MKQGGASVFPEVRRKPASRKRLVWIAGAAAGGLLSLGLGWLGVSIYVEAKVRGALADVARSRNLDISCEGVTVQLFGATLREVRVRAADDGASQLAVVLDEVAVHTSWRGAPQRIEVNGGRVEARGELDALRARLRRSGEGDAESSGPKTAPALEVGEVALDWSSAAASVHAQGVSLKRADALHTLGLRQLDVSAPGGERASLQGALVELEQGAAGWLLRNAHVAEVALVRPLPESPASPSPSPAAEPPAGLRLPWPEPGKLRLLLVSAAARANEHLSADAQITVAGLRLDLGGDVRFGPAPFRVTRREGALSAELSPEEAHAGATPLSFHVDIPTGERAQTDDPTARFAGGPVPLAALGFREGQLFLRHTERARLRGRGDVTLGSSVRVDVSVEVENLGLEHPRLAKVPIDDVSFGVDLRGQVSERRELVVEAAQLRLGDLRASARGSLAELPGATEPALVGHANVSIDDVACEVLHRAIPEALVPHLRDFRFDGRFAFGAQLDFDTRSLDDLLLDVRQGGVCRATSTPDWATRRHFQGEFTHTVYDPEGKPREETTGPGSGHYTGIDHISPFMQVAVLTSEDGGFYHHQGWSKTAIRRALIANLKAGRFRQGASTISMQLAKNLFLSRDKTLARKLEELVLTDYLEQTFEKSEMMELYLNLIEFGPDVYGITDASRYYFGREPEELQLAECMFLTSLLPSPVKRARQREKKELLGPARAGIDYLIRAAEKHGKITAMEMELGLTQPIVFHLGGERPAPRAPVHGSRFEGEEPEDPALLQ